MVWAGREDYGAAILLILVDGTGQPHHGNLAQYDEQDLHLAGGARRYRANYLATRTGPGRHHVAQTASCVAGCDGVD